MKPSNRLHRLQERWSRLTSTERETVRQWARLSKDRPRWLRPRIILLCLAGSSYRAVAPQVGCSDGTVRRAVDRFLDLGIDGICDGRLPPPEPEVRELLLRAARLGPKALGYPWNYWTLTRIKEFLRQETVRVVSTATVWRWLKRLGIRRMRVAPKPPNRWPKSRVLRTLRQPWRLARECRPDEVVVFVDESKLHLNPKLGFDWCLRGVQRWVRTPGDNRKLHLAMAFDHGSRRLTVVHGRSKKVGLFLGLLEALLRRYRHKRWIYVIADNACIHKAAAVQELVASTGGRSNFCFCLPIVRRQTL